MRRLYYVANDLETTVRISDKLHALGISDWNFHVIARDESGIYTHRLHSATPYHKQDIIRTGERWALAGAGAGLSAALLVAASPVGFDGLTGILLVLVGLLTGVCGGFISGRSRENHKIARFHDDIEAGRYLILVDVDKKSRADVIELMNLQFGAVNFRGSDSPFINPFVRT
jgi:hypothetical protein